MSGKHRQLTKTCDSYEGNRDCADRNPADRIVRKSFFEDYSAEKTLPENNQAKSISNIVNS